MQKCPRKAFPVFEHMYILLCLSICPYLSVRLNICKYIWRFASYRVLFESCVFSQFTATHPLHVEEQLILARDPNVQPLLFVDHFCTAHSSLVLIADNLQKHSLSQKRFKMMTIWERTRNMTGEPVLHKPQQNILYVKHLYSRTLHHTILQSLC